jgi:polyhydroxyalkanoate synthesis regulator phasin
MATLEITDKDIATVERLHDQLWGKGDMSAELQVLARQLIARMYESIREEQEEEEHNKPF